MREGSRGCRMSKYDALWAYIRESNQPKICLSFEAIAQIAGVPLDHSFLKYKAELSGYAVEKISMKAQTVVFVKREEG